MMHIKLSTPATVAFPFFQLLGTVILVALVVLLPSPLQAQQPAGLQQEGVIENTVHKTNDLKDSVVETAQSLPEEGRGLWAGLRRMERRAVKYVQEKAAACFSSFRRGLYAMRQNRKGLIAQQNQTLISHNHRGTKSKAKR